MAGVRKVDDLVPSSPHRRRRKGRVRLEKRALGPLPANFSNEPGTDFEDFAGCGRTVGVC